MPVRSRRTPFTALIVAIALLLTAAGTRGVINLSFTPVQLVADSQAILSLTVGPMDKNSALDVKIVRAVKGAAPQEGIQVLVPDPAALGELRATLVDAPAGGKLNGLAFYAIPPAPNAPPTVGMLNIDGHWFSLTTAGRRGAWRLGKDTQHLDAVWNGPAEMLERCVEYIAQDPNAAVPVRLGTTWNEQSKTQIGKVEGYVQALLLLDLAGDGKRSLFVASDKGDRLFTSDGAAFKDGTGAAKVTSASLAAAFGDFNADGKADLASWDGKSLTIFAQSATGTFEARVGSVALPQGCIGMAVVDTGTKGRAGVVVSTTASPAIVVPAQDGALTVRAVGGTALDGKLGKPLPCAVADFDSDGVADIVQPFDGGALFYKGQANAAFGAPADCGKLSAAGAARACVCDLDGDGQLDLLIAGAGAPVLWRNAGAGKFVEVRRTGEPTLLMAKDTTPRNGVVACDLNGDGRQDFMVLHKGAAPQVFFSRGFATFGFAADAMTPFKESAAGQQAAVMADFNNDGAQDLATVLADGSVWVLARALRRGPEPAVCATLPPAECAGPVRVTGFAGSRCLGAWNVTAFETEGYFARESPGPIKVQWQFPGGQPQEKTLIAKPGPTRFVLTR
jgi:hypothetical protein